MKAALDQNLPILSSCMIWDVEHLQLQCKQEHLNYWHILLWTFLTVVTIRLLWKRVKLVICGFTVASAPSFNNNTSAAQTLHYTEIDSSNTQAHECALQTAKITLKCSGVLLKVNFKSTLLTCLTSKLQECKMSLFATYFNKCFEFWISYYVFSNQETGEFLITWSL